ncbi:hypothetical protein [Streptomyces griseosporeus]
MRPDAESDIASWLIVVCGAITFAVTIGAVLAEEPSLRRFWES